MLLFLLRLDGGFPPTVRQERSTCQANEEKIDTRGFPLQARVAAEWLLPGSIAYSSPHRSSCSFPSAISKLELSQMSDLDQIESSSNNKRDRSTTHNRSYGKSCDEAEESAERLITNAAG